MNAELKRSFANVKPIVRQVEYPEITGQHLVKRNPGGTPDAKATGAALAARVVSI